VNCTQSERDDCKPSRRCHESEQKIRGSLAAPSGGNTDCELEIEANSELQFAHVGAVFQSRDEASCAVRAIGAVNTGCSTIVGTECIDRMIKHVEGIHAELSTSSLCDPE